MKRITVLLALLAPLWGDCHAVPISTNRVLVIGPSSMPVAAGTATLTIGMLQRTGGIYGGDYQMQVSPYFFKNEKGRLAIIVSDQSLAKLSQGKVVEIIGTATTSGKGGKIRPIESTATPAKNDPEHGTLKLWFMSGDRKMIFEPAYHFADKGTVAGLAPTTETNPASNLSRRLPASHREALEIADQHP